MFVLRATAKLRQRIGPSVPYKGEESTTLLGDWYATMLPWRTQVALLVNERTLLPALMRPSHLPPPWRPGSPTRSATCLPPTACPTP